MRHGLWLGLLLMGSATAAPQTLTSPATRVSLVELYTSEGCSSCPPAEAWLAGLQQDDRLWQAFVPVNFHVDYWDYLGWRDPFDSHAYTARQEALAARDSGNKVVYTPQFVVNGKDWQGFFYGGRLDVDEQPKVGVLSLSVSGKQVHVHFAPVAPVTTRLEAHVALLTFGVEVPVTAGENRGVTLKQDFLVVADTHGGLARGDGGYSAVMTLPAAVNTDAKGYALAAWVSVSGDPIPLQAVGGRLAGAP